MSVALQPVILSGGSGTRLWPLSREKYPKQLLALSGEQTMLQATATRLGGFAGDGVAGGAISVRAPIVVCNEEYRFVTAEQLRAAGCAQPTIVLEPLAVILLPLVFSHVARELECHRPVLR